MNRSQLVRYAESSSLMNIKISYKGEVFKFNLFEELKIQDNVLNRSVKEQSISFAFLILLHKRLIRDINDHELETKRLKAKLWVSTKENKQSRQTKEDLKNSLDMNPKILFREKQHIRLKSNIDIIEACIRAFEQRSNQLQTLSANIRKTS